MVRFGVYMSGEVVVFAIILVELDVIDFLDRKS